MPVNAINSSTDGAAAGVNRFAELSSEQFIEVLMTELQHQDPFEPQDSGALLEQLSSLRNIESQMLLQDKLTELVRQNQVTVAGGMIGKFVEGLDAANERIGGVVSSVRVVDNNVMLELEDGRTLNIAQVQWIGEPAS